jgi:N-terminal acetyltransferase B complex catalytic subunit
MSLLRPFSASDLFSFNAINLDAWTETYGVSYYLGYLSNYGDLFSSVYIVSIPLRDLADEGSRVVESAGGKGRVSGGGEGGGLMGYGELVSRRRCESELMLR